MRWEQYIAYYPCVIDPRLCLQKFDCGLQENWVWICEGKVISTLPSYAEREKLIIWTQRMQETFTSKKFRRLQAKRKSRTRCDLNPGPPDFKSRPLPIEPVQPPCPWLVGEPSNGMCENKLGFCLNWCPASLPRSYDTQNPKNKLVFCLNWCPASLPPKLWHQKNPKN